MRKRLVAAVLIISLLLPLFIFRAKAQGAFNDLYYYSPCDTPIRYRIGTIDPNFKVTHEELLTEAKTAANIWNTTQNKQLFEYDPSASFTINMVYDDRQKLTSEIDDLNKDLEQKQGEIDPKLAAYKVRQKEFENKLFSLNDRIKYWNERGGAPQEEYDKLVAEQKQLQEEAKALNAAAEELGQSTKEYNAGAQKLNETIDDFKQVLEFYPEEGLYERSGGERKISIYIDNDEAAFLHTLAHEFGHALGLEHLDDPKSIMYPQTTTVLSPSSEEVAMLSQICRQRTVFEVVRDRIEVVFLALASRLNKAAN